MIFWSAIVAMLVGATPAAQREINVAVAYRQPADAFEVIDNVSDWWPGYTDPEYRTYWADSIGITSTDSMLFARYKLLRERYFDRSGQQNEDPRKSRAGLFTDSGVLSADPLAMAFYSSNTMEEAFIRLKQIVTPDDISFLRSFFEHFAPRLEPLTSETRQVVAASMERTRQVLTDSAVAVYLEGIGAFFGVDADLTFTALYVWWPDSEQVRATPKGPFLILRIKPYPDETMSNADVVVHEAVHVVSAMQSDEQKRNLSDAVLNECAGSLDHTRRLGVVEEPLATIFGNIEFRRRFDPDRFSWGRKWYGELWADLSARLLYPVVMSAAERGGSLGSPTMSSELAAQCRIVLSLHERAEYQPQ